MAEANTSIALEIVTPAGVQLRAQVNELTAPSVAGEFGVLPGHLPVLAALRTGIVTYKQNAKENREDVDVVRVRRRLKEVDDELDHWTGELTDPRRAELIEEEQWLATELELIGDPPPPMVREDTRYVVAHAQPPPVEELAMESQPDENLTDIRKPAPPH
jgi:F-type H+-transporting ATPase subunit epsilon